MKTASAISITMPTSMLKMAQDLAKQENRTLSELMRETLRSYIQRKQEWEALNAYGRARAKAMGIKPGDVNRLIHEARKEERLANKKNRLND